jgi:hypothetical protein
MPNGADVALFAKLCVDHWKLIQRFTKALQLVSEGERARLLSQLRYSELQLTALASEAGLKIVTFDGEPYGPGCPASADNLGDFATDENLFVEKTLEPTVVHDMRTLLAGRVLLASNTTPSTGR